MDDEEEQKNSSGASSSDDNLESEWGFIDHAKADERQDNHARPKQQRTQTAAPTTSGQSRFLNMMVNSKNKFFSSFYNIYQGVPSEPAGFGIEDIWCLGKVFKLPSKDVRKPVYLDERYAFENSHYALSFKAAPLALFLNTTIAEKRQVRKGSRQFLHAIQFLEEIEFGFVWFTYRRDFPTLETYGSSSDIGWGCMLRTAQMMLAKVLATLYFGRNWRLTEEDMRNPSSIYREVLRWFVDRPSTADRPRPYSIHSFIHVNNLLHDNTYGQHPMSNLTGGEWFSPTKVAHILEFLVKTHQPNGLVMYVPSDCAIYMDKVLELCSIPAKPPTTTCSKTNDHNPLDPETPLEPNHKPDGEVRGEDILKTVLPPSTVNPLRRSAGATIQTGPHNDSSDDDDFSHERLVKSVIGEITPPEQRSHHLHQDSTSTSTTTTSTTTPANTIDSKPNANSKNKSITELLSRTNTAGDFRPVFFLIASRIGIEKPNKVYFSHLHAILQSKFCVGILGGKPKASLYFVAQQGDQVIYLDPHLVQESINPDNASPRRKVVQSYHCKIPQKMHISAIDPSLAIGFLCLNREEFFEFVAWHESLQSSGIQTIFTIQPSMPEYLTNSHATSKRKSSDSESFPMDGDSSTTNIVNSSTTPTGKLYPATDNQQNRRDSSSSDDFFS